MPAVVNIPYDVLILGILKNSLIDPVPSPIMKFGCVKPEVTMLRYFMLWVQVRAH